MCYRLYACTLVHAHVEWGVETEGETAGLVIEVVARYAQVKKEVVEYAWTDGELEELRQKFGRGAILQRYKGLGEMNADQLWETTMDPETRTLIRVTIDDLARAERRVSVLMGDKPAPRRQWIEDNVKFTLEESGVF